MTILCFDTSTKSCSISLFEHKALVDAVDILDEKYVHSEKLHTEIENLLQKNNRDVSDLDAVAIGKGPAILHRTSNRRFSCKRVFVFH